MKILLPIMILSASTLNAQCLSVNANQNQQFYATPNQCGLTVNYTTPVFQSSCLNTVSDTFYFTGNAQQFTVPSGVTSVQIETWGAQGGANWVNNTNFGGYNKADFTVNAGDLLHVFVGGQATGLAGGFNGGGAGDGAGIGGGGASDVRLINSTLNDRIIVSGGGGGAGYWSGFHVVGGTGGGNNGGDGYRNTTAEPGGLGATVSGPGANGTCINLNVTSMAGSFGIGGTPAGFNCGCEGYGGGGGYYGGAGSGNCRGGGGGSGYVAPNGTNVTSTNGVRAGNGMVVISYLSSSPINVTQIAGLASGQTFPNGTTTNTFLAVSDGDSLSTSFDVTIIDTIAPSLLNPMNMTASTDAGSCFATITPDPILAFDNCGIASSTNNAPATFPIGVTNVVWTVIDNNGNSSSFNQTITVTDNEAPMFVNSSTDIITCEGSTIQFLTPGFTDNCSASAVQISGPTSGSSPAVGNYTAVFVVTDGNNNSDTTSFQITITAPPTVTLSFTPNISNPCINHPAVTLFGASPAGGVWSGNGVTGDQFNPATVGVGQHVITYTYTDMFGCEGFASDTIFVNGCAGINESTEENFFVYPNPSSQSLTISATANTNIQLIDAQGKMILSRKMEWVTTDIDVSTIANGLYTILLTSENGNVQVHQITIQH